MILTRSTVASSLKNCPPETKVQEINSEQAFLRLHKALILHFADKEDWSGFPSVIYDTDDQKREIKVDVPEPSFCKVIGKNGLLFLESELSSLSDSALKKYTEFISEDLKVDVKRFELTYAGLREALMHLTTPVASSYTAYIKQKTPRVQVQKCFYDRSNGNATNKGWGVRWNKQTVFKRWMVCLAGPLHLSKLKVKN